MMKRQVRYSISDIDRMRAAIKSNGGGEVEDRLRTYMLNGTTADELCAEMRRQRNERMMAEITAHKAESAAKKEAEDFFKEPSAGVIVTQVECDGRVVKIGASDGRTISIDVDSGYGYNQISYICDRLGVGKIDDGSELIGMKLAPKDNRPWPLKFLSAH